MTKTEKYLEGLTIHKVPYNIANTSDFKTNVMGKAADNELFIITDTPTFSLKIGNVTYDGTSNVSATTATQSVSGLMSAADKKKLDGIATGATKITVDTSISSTSTNPVQNKVIKTELDKKAGTAVATTSANGLMSAADKKKLDGIATGATKITVDTSISSTSTNPVQNKVIKTELDKKAGTAVATTSANGLMSAADKIALDGKLDKTGGTLTGNLTGRYLTGTWLQTTASTDLGRTPGKVAVLDDSGWVYYRTPAELKSDIGANSYLPTSGGTMTGAITTKGIKLTSGTDFGSSLPSSMQSNQLFFQTLGSNYILDNVYPVGSIYMSVNSTNPKKLFGGTWEQIQGKFLFGMNSSYPAGSTGGEITHKLTQNEMPRHYHEGLYYSYEDTENLITLNSGSVSYHIPWGSSDYAGDYGAGNGAKELVTGTAGSDEAHNNMPPYLSVYIWKRTK